MEKIFHFVKSNDLSGLENVVINICTLVKGYNYVYVSTSGPINKVLNRYKIKHLIIPNLNPLTILKVIRKYKPDIVQAHDPLMSVLMFPSYFFCKKYNIRMISELHNTDPKMKSWWRLRSILYLISSFFYNTIIVVSKRTLYNYIYNKYIRNKVSIIPNIVNVYRIRKMLKLSIKNKKWDCMFLGRITYQKNPLKFVEIINELKKKKKNIRAVIVGNGDLLPKVKSLISKYKLCNNIDCVGFQSNPYKYLQKSKLLIITSRFEGFCLVALESLVIGIPVVSTPLKVLEHLLGDKCVHFESNNFEFVNDIYDLINDNGKYNYFKNISIKEANSINDISKFVSKYNNVYSLN